MSWLNRVSSFFAGDENTPPRNNHNNNPAVSGNEFYSSPTSNNNNNMSDLFTFQFLEPGSLAYLRIKSLKGRYPACTPEQLEEGLQELTAYLSQISQNDPQMACIVGNFTPFDSQMLAPFGTPLPPFVELTSSSSMHNSPSSSTGASAAASSLASSSLQSINHHHITPFDRLDKLVQYCATMVTLSSQQRQLSQNHSRVILLVFCEENQYDHDLVDYSLLAVTALRMFQGKLQYLDAGDAMDIIKEQFNIHQSVRHASSHRSVLKKFRTLFQIPSFAGSKSALHLSKIVLQMPNPLSNGVRGLRLVLDCQGDPVFQSDEMWTQGSSPKELVLNVEKISSKIISLYGDCTLTLLRLDQGQPQLLLRAAFSTLFVSSSASFIEVPSSDMDFEPIWRGQTLPGKMFTPRAMRIFISHHEATKNQQSHASDILRDVDFAELKKMYEEMSEMDPAHAQEIIRESVALAGSPNRNQSFAVNNNSTLNRNNNNNHSILSNSNNTIGATSNSPQSIAAAAVADAKKRQQDILDEQHQPSSSETQGVEEEQEDDYNNNNNSLEPSQLLYVSIRRQENNDALAECFAEFLSLHKNGSKIRTLSSSVARPGSLYQPRSDQNNHQQNNNYTSTIGRAPAAYPSSSSLYTSNKSQQHNHLLQNQNTNRVKIIPKTQWKKSTGKCQYQDCGITYGIFSNYGNCHSCGLHCCSSCLADKISLPPEYPDPVAVCPRCHVRLQMASQQQQQHYHQTTTSSSPQNNNDNNNYGSNIQFIDPTTGTSQNQENNNNNNKRFGTPPPHEAGSNNNQRHQTPTSQTKSGNNYPTNIQFIDPTNATPGGSATARRVSPTPNNNNNNNNNQISVNIKVCRREKWQDPSKVNRCQFQDCRNTFAFWTKGSNCHLCGLVCCNSCLTGKTTLPPTYANEAVPVCSRCYSTSEILKKDAAQKRQNQNASKEHQQQQQQQQSATRGDAASAALKNLNYRDTSNSRSPQRNTTTSSYHQQVSSSSRDMALLLTSPQERKSNAAGLGSKKTSFSIAALSTNNNNNDINQDHQHSPLHRDRSGGNFLAFKRRQEENNMNNNNRTSPTPNKEIINSQDDGTSTPQNVVLGGNAIGHEISFDNDDNNDTTSNRNQDDNNNVSSEPIEGIPIVQEHDDNNNNNNTTVPSSLDNTMNDTKKDLASTQIPNHHNHHVDPNAANDVVNNVEIAPPRTRSDTIAPTVVENKINNNEPTNNTVASTAGGMGGVLAELQRKAAEKEAAAAAESKSATTDDVEKKPKETEVAEQQVNIKKPDVDESSPKIDDPSHPDYYKQGTKTINESDGTPASTLKPPPVIFKPLHLNSSKAVKGNMPPVPGPKKEETEEVVHQEEQQQVSNLLEDRYLKPEDEPFRTEPKPHPDYVDDGVKSTTKAPPIKFRPVRNSKTAIKGKMPRVPGPQKEETEEATTHAFIENPEDVKFRTPQPNPDYVDDGEKSTLKAPPIRYRPIRNSATAIKGKMPPVPGPKKENNNNSSTGDENSNNNPPSPSRLDMGSLAAMLQSKLKMAPSTSNAPGKNPAAKKAPAGPKIKTIFWKKLTGDKLRRSVLWTMDTEKMSSPHDSQVPLIPKANEDRVRSMFEIKTKEKSASSQQNGKDGLTADGKKKSAAVTAQRQQNVGIALKKMRKSADELKDAILACDNEVFSAEMLDAVLKIMPQDDEIRNLKAEKSSGNFAFGEVEDFLYTIAVSVPDAKERLSLWRTAMEIPRQIELAEAQLEFQNAAANAIANESSDYVRILRCILNIGNAVNKGTAQGNAGGFTLESLVNTLLGTKATDNKTTLLELVFEHFGEEEVEKMEFGDELCNKLTPAIGCPVASVSTLISSIANSVQRLKKIANSKNADNSEDKLIQLMSDSHQQFSGSAADLLLRLQEMKDQVAGALEFLGEERTADDTIVFNQLISFCKEFNKHRGVWLRKLQAVAKRKEAEEKEKQKEEEKAARKKMANENNNGVDDNSTPTSPLTIVENPNEEGNIDDENRSPRLRPTKTKVFDKNDSERNKTEVAKDEEGWETTDRKKQEQQAISNNNTTDDSANHAGSSPAALFSRIPPPRQVKFDDDDDEDW